jgi:hypothetical protein
MGRHVHGDLIAKAPVSGKSLPKCLAQAALAWCCSLSGTCRFVLGPLWRGATQAYRSADLLSSKAAEQGWGLCALILASRSRCAAET